MKESLDEIDITIPTRFLASFANKPLEPYKVFREFIDNSLQSYLDNKQALDDLPKSAKKCVVNIAWNENEIVVTDNAFGMNRDDFARALKLGEKSERSDEGDRLSRFGEGLKDAAFFAAHDCIIETVALGSGEHYHIDMDLDYIEKHSPNKIPYESQACDSSEHGTRIRLKKLNPICTYSNSLEKRVRKSLGRIYSAYLSDGFLEIDLNNQPIIYDEPELFVREDTDSEAICYFANEDGFEFQGKRYRYEGEIGILKTGDSSGYGTGFDYFQARRCIVFSDHPEKLFGKHNDRRFQHVYGKIYLKGNEWPITANKDKIKWDQGLEEQFIADLMKNEGVAEIFKIAHKTKYREASANANRKKTAPPTAEDFQPKPSITPSGGYASITVAQPKKTSVSKKVEYAGDVKTIDIEIFDDDPDRDFIHLSQGEEGKTKIEVNLSSPFVAPYLGSDKAKQLLYAFAVAFALARIEANKQGFKLNESYALETALNQIMRKAK